MIDWSACMAERRRICASFVLFLYGLGDRLQLSCLEVVDEEAAVCFRKELIGRRLFVCG